MQNQSIIVPGSYKKTFDPWGRPPGATEVLVSNGTKDVVTGYALVKGDKKRPTPFSYEALFERFPVGQSWNRFGNSMSALNDGSIPFNPSIWEGTKAQIPNLLNMYYNRALAKVNEKTRGQLDLSIDALQFASTKRMLANMGKASSYLGNLRKAARKGGSQLGEASLKALLKDAGGNWLQWVYGFKPLIEDIYGAVDEFYRHDLPTLLTIKEKAYGLLGDQAEYKPSPLRSKIYVDLDGVQGVTFHMQFKDKGGFDLSRWGSLNPVSWVWEMIPYSFVVDWMYDVGGMISSLETSLLYDSQFVSGYYTELRAIQGGLWVSKPPPTVLPNDGKSETYMVAKGQFRYTYFKRTVLGSYPAPRPPTFKLQMGWERALSASALLAQHLR